MVRGRYVFDIFLLIGIIVKVNVGKLNFEEEINELKLNIVVVFF